MTAFLSDSLAVACDRIICLFADTVAELNAGSTTPQALDEEGELATIGTTLQTTVSTSQAQLVTHKTMIARQHGMA